MIDTQGFMTCEIVETEGGGDEWLFVFADDFTFGIGGATSAPASAVRPQTASLLPNLPNPCSRQTAIRFELTATTGVDLVICDAAGRMVRRLTGGALHGPGYHELVWRGENDAGQRVPAGVYFYSLEADASRQTRRLLMIE